MGRRRGATWPPSSSSKTEAFLIPKIPRLCRPAVVTRHSRVLGVATKGGLREMEKSIEIVVFVDSVVVFSSAPESPPKALSA